MLNLLVLSNGHGEDVIAIRIIQQLQSSRRLLQISALPMVGQGHAYTAANIPLIGSVRTMPSGGFIYMDGQQFIRDLRFGLLQLTFSQMRTVRRWARSHKDGTILAVGDIVPLLFAWISGLNYAFVGTAKSEYYVRDEAGLLQRKTRGARWENFSGSVYHPWERWMMTHHRCKGVFPRDSLTTEILQQFSVPAFDLGNPMMDGLEPKYPSARFFGGINVEQQELERSLVITLLPGSRPLEAYKNWQLIMTAVAGMLNTFRDKRLVFLGAIAPSIDLTTLQQILASQSWRQTSEIPSQVQIPDAEAVIYKQKNAYVILTQRAFNDCLHQADLAIAMAGTATEQFVGLGKPAITIPGNGPQFNPAFAEAQSRHLGVSVIMVDHPQDVAKTVQALFNDPDRLQLIADNGVRRMGWPGAAQRIAECLLQRCL